MSKIITIPSSIDEINKTLNIIDGFIIGIDNMSVNTNLNISINSISILDDYKDKDIFISLNKNMHNIDLKCLKDIMIKLNSYNIKGVLYYDVAVLQIYKEIKPNYELVWSQEHSTTNYSTINYWYEKGAKYTYLSSDITFEEIKEIKQNSKSTLLVNLFGYLPMFVSKRHIVKNYLNYFKLKDSSKINYMEKENKIYPIMDKEIGTMCYSNNILNGLKYSLDLLDCYIVLNSLDIDLNKFICIINLFRNVNSKNIEDSNNKINNMFNNVDLGFLEKKTIYKVKKNDK